MKEKNTIPIDIIQACQKGDEDAFSKLYELSYKRVYFFAYSYTNDSELAKDVVQNTFLNVWKDIKNLKVPVAFHSWLMKITYHQCYSLFRRQKFRYVSNSDKFDVEDVADQSNGLPMSTIEKSRMNELVQGCLSDMGSDLQNVGILRFYEELSIKEISSILDIPEGTVKSRIHKIKQRLVYVLNKKGISTKNFYASAIPTMLFAKAYASMSDTVVSKATAMPVIKEIIGAGTMPSLFGMFALHAKPILIGTAALTIAGTATFLNLTNNNKQEEIGVMHVERPIIEMVPCKFERITYDEAFTNQNINLEITTTNDAYDRILINDVETKMVEANGTYTIKLIKGNEVLDEREILIQNIDRDAPTLEYTERNENRYYMHLNDATSGIDSTKIQFYTNGIRQSEFQYDEVNHILSFYYQERSLNTFYITDKAGNMSELRVDSKLTLEK